NALATDIYNREDLAIVDAPVSSSPFARMEAFSSKIQSDLGDSDEDIALEISNSGQTADSARNLKASAFSSQLGRPPRYSQKTSPSVLKKTKKKNFVKKDPRDKSRSVLKKSKNSRKVASKLANKTKKSKAAQKRLRGGTYSSI